MKKRIKPNWFNQLSKIKLTKKIFNNNCIIYTQNEIIPKMKFAKKIKNWARKNLRANFGHAADQTHLLPQIIVSMNAAHLYFL